MLRLTVVAIALVPSLPALAQPAPEPIPEPTPAPEPALAPEPAPTEVPEPTPPTETEEAAPAETSEVRTLAPTINGYVDATYNYNFLRPAGGVTLFHSYTAQHQTFLLNSAHLALTGSDQNVSYAVEIDAGSDAAVTSGDDDFDIQEAWLAYACDCGLGFKVGKFVTFNGIEVIESPSNPTISRGFLFGLAEPFTHVGGVVTYKINDQLDVALGLVNGWDLVTDNNSYKTAIAKVGFTTDTLGITVSGSAGPEQPLDNDNWRYAVDATAVAKLGLFDLWLQANVGSEEAAAAGGDSAVWTGFGVQPVIRLGEKLTLGARAELFHDGDAARTGVEQTLINVSAAPALALSKHLVLRAELRVDFSSEDVYADPDGDAGASQVIGLGEAIVLF
jgi:hypothetical protein